MSVPPNEQPRQNSHGGSESTLLMYREIDRLERAIEDNKRRIEHLDEHGSRGVDQLKSQIEQIRRDIEDHESAHKEAVNVQRTGRRWTVGILVALVTPLYPLLLAVLYHAR